MITLILGESGSGKTRSVKNLDRSKTAIIKSFEKPLPFKSGNEFSQAVCDSLSKLRIWLEKIIAKNEKEIVVIDDFQFLLADVILKDQTEKNKFSKYQTLALDVKEIFLMAALSKIRFYFLAHTEQDDDQTIKMKTVGKFLKDNMTPESFFTVVLRCRKDTSGHFFQTENSGSDTVKAPEEMFDSPRIDNDLKLVDDSICDFYGIKDPKK